MTTAVRSTLITPPYLPHVTAPPSTSRQLAACGHYQALLASTDEERSAIYRLRFKVFNLELNEGLESSYTTGEDRDEFDAICEQLQSRQSDPELRTVATPEFYMPPAPPKEATKVPRLLRAYLSVGAHIC